MHALLLTHATPSVCSVLSALSALSQVTNEKPESTGESNAYAFQQVREL